MAALNFNANEVPPEESRELIPAGNYLALIENSELVTTKAGTGTMLALTFSILEGPYQHRKVFTRLNVQNQNAVAEQIGQRQLSQLCHAVGRLQISDSSELHLLPMVIRVAIDRDKTGQYGDRNDIKEFKPATGQPAIPAPATRPAFQQPAAARPAQAPRPAPQAAAPAAAPPKPAPAGNTNKPAWAR